jgi:hypothetical protein
MRARFTLGVLSGVALAGCSLLVSEDFASEDPAPPAEAGAGDTGTGGDDARLGEADSGNDTATDTGGDAALDPSLLAFWTFDNGTDVVQKDETKRYDLVTSGASIDANAGVHGGALVFSGNPMARVARLQR